MQEKKALDQLPLASFKGLFHSLPIPAIHELHGVYHGTFTGPGWVRALAGPALVLGGLPGWCGKTFDGRGNGANLLCRGEEMVEAVPIRLETRLSFVDGLPGLAVIYPDSSPFPLRFIRDELRRLDDGRLLGLTMVARFGLQRFAFPFLLAK